MSPEEITELLGQIVYGDVEEVPLDIIKDICDVTPEKLEFFDEEQRLRVAIAATVAKLLGRKIL